MREAVASVEACGLPGEWRSKPATPRRILGYARNAVTPVCTLRAHVLLRRIWLHKLLSRQGALLTDIPYLFPALGSLCCRKTPQLAVFATLQNALSPQLLPCIELLLPLRLQICLRLRIRHVCSGLRVRPVWLCLCGLRGRRELTLPFCTQLLSLDVPLLLNLALRSLDVPLLLNVALLLLNIAVDHCRCLMALRSRKIWPGRVGRRARDVRRRHLRPWGLRSCDLRWRGARRRDMGHGAWRSLRRGRPRGRGRWSCGRRPWRGVWRTGFGPGILCSSGHRNGDGQRGGQRHSSSQIHHRRSSTSAEL
jgi:hypothetical protein